MTTTTRRTILKWALSLPAATVTYSQATQGDPIALAATGEKIPHPLRAKPEAMVYVPAGKFTMGERDTEHEVFLDGFRIAKYLVTNAEYKAFADAAGGIHRPRHWSSGTFPEGKDNHPVLWVSWNDAREYCAWVSAGTGRAVNLPTEAQWEKAARGPNLFIYPWGNSANPDYLNFNGLCARKYGLAVSEDGHVAGWREFTESAAYRDLIDRGGYTTPVGAFPQGKSGYGCYDMAGNAWEWCTDWYGSQYFQAPSANRNPQGPGEEQAEMVNRAAEHGKVKVIRGGSWYAQLSSARSVNREETRRPGGGYHSVGFRIVATIEA